MPTDTGPMRRIEVVAYRRDWPATFTRFVAELLPVVGPALVGIEHIGSTSVPGLVAKPVIDILLLADPLGALDARDAQFAAIDLEPRGEYGIPGRRFFVRGGRRRDWRSH